MYHIQIGLDIGSLYSKCVYRDLYNAPEIPYVFYFKAEHDYNILIPSYITYKDKEFIFNDSINLYSEYGLWDIIYAVASLCDAKNSHLYLSRFSEVSKLHIYSNELKNFVKSSYIFLLSRILSFIKKEIVENFSDFGKDNNDKIQVNMALPTNYFINNEIKELFCALLHTSLNLALSKSLSSNSSLEKIQEDINNIAPNTTNKLCYVYPEASASFFALKKLTNIDFNNTFLYTNTDMFHCKQSLFKYDKNEKNINYITTSVFQIEKNSVENIDSYLQLYEEQLIYSDFKNIDDEDIKNYLHNIERNIYNQTRENTLQLLITTLKKNDSISFVKSIFDNISLIFSGDPYINYFSQKGIFRALDFYTTILKKINWNNRTIYFNKYIELNKYKNIRYLLQFLDIAYGLSFSYNELPNNIYSSTKILYNKSPKQIINTIYDNHKEPGEVQIIQHKGKKKKKRRTIIKRFLNNKTCPFCLGKNPHCIYCGGF